MKKSKSGASGWIWAIVIAGVAGLAYYLWKKSQPVEDPWSTPLNNRPSDARPVGSVPSTRLVEDEESSEVDSEPTLLATTDSDLLEEDEIDRAINVDEAKKAEEDDKDNNN